MESKIGLFHVLLLEGTLNKNNIEAIIKKSMDLFEREQEFLQCCSIDGMPSMRFALNAMENALAGKKIGKAKLKKKSLSFLLWLYCTNQLDKAIEFAGKWEKGVLLAIAAKDKAKLNRALELAKELGFKEKNGIIEKNFRENLESFIEKFKISENELKAFSQMPKHKAIEKLLIERQALMAL